MAKKPAPEPTTPEETDVLAEFENLAGDALPPVDPNVLKTLAELADKAIAAEAAVEEAKLALDVAEKRLVDLVDRQIPEKMDEARVKTFTTDTDLTIKLQERLRINVKKDDKPEAMDWFDNNGMAALVKRTITIDFDKDEEKWAKKFLQDCAKRKQKLRLVEKRDVHHSTLTKQITELIEAGEVDVPAIFGRFNQRSAKVTKL